MSLRLRRWMVLSLAWLPLAAGAQSAVGDAATDPVPEIKAGNLAFVAGFDTLYRLDLSNGATSAVGSGFGFAGGAQIADVDGLAFSADGTLYAVADSPRPSLFRVSTASGRATLIGQFREAGSLIDNGTNLNAAIGFTCSGKLLMASRERNRLWEVDLSNAEVRPIGSLSTAIGGIAAVASNVYALGVGSSAGLYRLNEPNASANRIPNVLGDRPIPAGGALAAASDGTLFAVVDPQPAARQYLLAFSPDGGVTRELTITGSPFNSNNAAGIRALAIGPPVCAPLVVGAPGAASIPALDSRMLALLALLMGAIALVALRRTAP
ncbi:MAG: hypothetical protein LW860_00640 [Xanthomonadaceae bacterium]|jgi:hypothetical protein|nr:hypothetical protein [Xanthomonadaceae bacterium]